MNYVGAKDFPRGAGPHPRAAWRPPTGMAVLFAMAVIVGSGILWPSAVVQAQNPCCVIVEPADTNLTVMRSGTEYPLQNRTRPIQFPADPWPYSIRFQFGFATDEQGGDGEILDSVTLFLANTNTGVSATLFTADAAGFAWVPFSPGLLTLSPDSIRALPGSLPPIQPMASLRLAYEVTFDVPPLLSVGWTEVTLMLFDYPNGLNSVAWLEAVSIIPPPGRLEVVGSGAYLTAGPTGGPFTPSTRSYTLTNAGGQNLTWLASTPANWLGLSPPGGVLAPRTTTNLNLRVTSQPRVFPPGRYPSSVLLTNASLPASGLILPAELVVADRPFLEIQPSAIPGPGSLAVRVTATPSAPYRIETSADLASWTALVTNTPGADGVFTLTLPAAELSGRRFFRASFVQP